MVDIVKGARKKLAQSMQAERSYYTALRRIQRTDRAFDKATSEGAKARVFVLVVEAAIEGEAVETDVDTVVRAVTPRVGALLVRDVDARVEVEMYVRQKRLALMRAQDRLRRIDLAVAVYESGEAIVREMAAEVLEKGSGIELLTMGSDELCDQIEKELDNQELAAARKPVRETLKAVEKPKRDTGSVPDVDKDLVTDEELWNADP